MRRAIGAPSKRETPRNGSSVMGASGISPDEYLQVDGDC
jgi:hypothetical protein